MAEEKKKKSFAERFLKGGMLFLIAVAAFFLVGLIAVGYIEEKKFVIDANNITNQNFLYIFGALCLISLVLFLTNLTKDKDKKSSGAKIEHLDGMKKYHDTNWMTEDELIKNPIFNYSDYTELKNKKKVGIPVRAEYKKGKLHINMFTPPIHTIVIGTTGTGKTTQFVDPMMQILSESGARPCIVVSDPKGEIMENHGAKLEKNGYRLMVFDLREPFKSTCWNPLARPFDLNYQANHLHEKVIRHNGEDPRKTNLTLASKIYYSEWYELDGFAFGVKSDLDNYIEGRKQKLKNDAFEDMRDLAMAISPVLSQNDPVWERGACDMILATMLAMLEDSEKPELGMTKEKFNFYNLSKILMTRDADPYDNVKTLKEYFQGRDPLSLAVQYSNQILGNNERTMSSYLGVLSDKLNLFGDSGICYATSVNEMNLNDFCSKPTALFIKIPDEKVTRYPIATMFISQLYKILVDIAIKAGGALPRDTYFLLDEFGNLPKIQDFQNIITVARSRKIWFILILQSYAQLKIKYGEDVARTVEDNCNIHIYIASNDRETQKKFSERCGNITVRTKTISEGKGKGDDSKTTNTGISEESRPLIYPDELGTLKDDMIVTILKQPPIRAVFTPAYKIRNWDDPKYGKQSMAPIYDMVPMPPENILPKRLDEVKMFYDIRKRNSIVLKKSAKNDQFDW